MLKKKMHKRLLAGVLATVMALTMCPTWALADNEGITTLPAQEGQMPVVDVTPAEDNIQTPDVPSSSETEAQPAEGQNTASGTDTAESGNSNESIKNDSQNDNAVSNSPANEIAKQEDDRPSKPVESSVQTIKAEYWITNRKASADGASSMTIDEATVGNGKAVTEIAPDERQATTTDGTYNTVFWQARVHNKDRKQTEQGGDDKTGEGTEITSIRYNDDQFEYLAKDSSNWTKFVNGDQLVFYYLIRTEYSQMVQIDVSDWAFNDSEVDNKYKNDSSHYSVTYQVIVKDGPDANTVLSSKKFWYNSAVNVSAVRVRQTKTADYTIDSVVLDPEKVGKVAEVNDEYQFGIKLSNTSRKSHNATVKIYVSATSHELTYNANDGTLADGSYSKGKVYPKVELTLPTDAEITRDGYTFAGWYDEVNNKLYQTGDLMPNNDLRLTAHWTKNTPDPDPEPENQKAMYFILLPELGTPTSGASQGKANYLPNNSSDGGVLNANGATGYTGYLTTEGKKVADEGGTFNVNGVDNSYLIKPEDLGFFTKTNWNGTTYPANMTNTAAADITKLLVGFNPQTVEVVWYTVKYDSTDGYHVDGYIKNADVDVTYHSNFGNDATKVVTAKTGTEYTAVDYATTELPTRANYEFGGWYKNTACTEEYTSTVLMSSLHLYAKWIPDSYKVIYKVDGVESKSTDYTYGSDVMIDAAPTKEGHEFSGWKIGDKAAKDFTMPAHDVIIEGNFTKNPAPEKYEYAIEHYKYNPETKAYVLAETESDSAVADTEITATPKSYDGYVLNPYADGYLKSGKVFAPVTDENGNVTKLTLKLFYDPDTKGNSEDPENKGDGIPDRFQYKVTEKVVNGKWDSHTKDNKDIIFYVSTINMETGEKVQPKLAAADIAQAGNTPDAGYRAAGSWDVEPKVDMEIKADTVFTYTYARRSSSGGGSSSGGKKPTVEIPDEVPTGLNGNDHYAYIVGYPDSTVRPQNGITRAEVATIFFRLLTDEVRNANSTQTNSYSDVVSTDWYNHAVSTLSAMGIIKGDTHGKFNPNAPITRAEFAAIAARFDENANTTTADFSDIASHWAKDEISAAANNGWINGYTDGTFRPNNNITRAEAMTLVNRVLKRLPETAEDLHNDMIKWSDNSDTSKWYYLAVQEATNSHYYDTKENQYEKWNELRETRDWTELEK